MKRVSYVLLLLADGVAMTSREIAKATGKPKANVSADLYSLKRRGLVGGTPRRGTAYAITAEGRDHLKRTVADTKTSRILDAYASGDSLSAKDVEAITGIDLIRVRNVSQRLQAQGLLELISEEGTRNVRRKLTEEGEKLVKTADVEPPAMDAETTIRVAVRTRSALELAWGARA